MIVPAKKQFFGAERFAVGNLKKGETFSVDSGLGGSWTLEFDAAYGPQLLFVRRAKQDWPEVFYRYADSEDASRNLYVLVPENEHL